MNCQEILFVFTSPDKAMTPEVLEDNLMPKVGDAACSLENGNNNRKHGFPQKQGFQCSSEAENHVMVKYYWKILGS